MHRRRPGYNGLHLRPQKLTMAEPPSYEESTSSFFVDEKGDSKSLQRFSIREEVALSRSQHVAALVSKLLPQIRERAKSGLSKSTLFLMPSDQGQCCRTPGPSVLLIFGPRLRRERPASRASRRRTAITHPTRRSSGRPRVLGAERSARPTPRSDAYSDVR